MNKYLVSCVNRWTGEIRQFIFGDDCPMVDAEEFANKSDINWTVFANCIDEHGGITLTAGSPVVGGIEADDEQSTGGIMEELAA